MSYDDNSAPSYDTLADADPNLTTSQKYNAQPKPRKSANQLRNGNGNANGLSRSASIDTPNAYSSSDYGPANKASRERLRDMSSERPRVRRKTSKGVVALLDGKIPEGEEHSKWIHRDKLAAIESRELAEMGLRLRHSRSTSRARSARTNQSSIDAADPTTTEPMPGLDEEGRASRSDWRAADDVQSPDAFADAVSQRDNLARPGTSSGKSRLPVSRDTTPFESQSPTDGHEHARSGSRELHMQKQRLRSQSGTLLQADADSPRDGRARTLPPSASRKASAANNGKRDPSTNSETSPNRPTTSGRSRPSTRNGVPSGPINRPEGDPPWIDQMYKPDPRLPPDQQMLPTHARRMAELQRQAEERQAREAAQGDGEFVLMDSEGSASDEHEPKKQMADKAAPSSHPEHPAFRQAAQGSPTKSEHKRESGQWPLRTPTPTQSAFDPAVRNDASSSHHRANTTDSANSHGGYNLLPVIQSQEAQEKAIEMQQARLSMRSRTSHHGVSHGRHLSAEQWQENASQAPVHQPVHLNPHDDKKPKDGCLSCCVVM